MNMKLNYYSTSDLSLATTLALFLPIETINRKNPARINFVFVRNQYFNELLEKYWNGQIKVEPKAYYQQLKIMKSRLYEER